ncbi:hypothetical protein ACLBWS_05860 [Brucellaceae bacterium D45D]
MTNLLIALGGVALVAFCLYSGLAYMRFYNRRYEAYREHANCFYEAADRLIDNKNTPEDVVRFVNEMNSTINFPDAAFAFSMIVMKNRKNRKLGIKKNPRFNLRSMPEDVIADFVIAFEHWIEAMACRGMGWGLIFKGLLDAPIIEEKAKSVAKISSKSALAVQAH